MTNPDNSNAPPDGAAQRGGGRWRYHALFGAQTVGTVILLWNSVPLYRQILANPAAHEARSEHLVWALSSIGLMQVGYWISYRAHPPLPRFSNALLGNVTLFVARMSFVFATSVFGFMFITQKPGFQFRPSVTSSPFWACSLCIATFRN